MPPLAPSSYQIGGFGQQPAPSYTPPTNPGYISTAPFGPIGGMQRNPDGSIGRAPIPQAPASPGSYVPPTAPYGSTGLGGITQNPDGSYGRTQLGPGRVAQRTVPQPMTSAPRPPAGGALPGGLPPIREGTPSSGWNHAPYDYMLQDSNPVKHIKPVATSGSQSTSGADPRGGFPAMSSGSQGGGGTGGGYVLGSSVGPPSGYGAGLAPASGLGGGLYPSLVGLYR